MFGPCVNSQLTHQPLQVIQSSTYSGITSVLKFYSPVKVQVIRIILPLIHFSVCVHRHISVRCC